jgi:hypothetical protein
MSKRVKSLQAKAPGRALIIGYQPVKTKGDGKVCIWFAIDEFSGFLFPPQIVPFANEKSVFESLPDFVLSSIKNIGAKHKTEKLDIVLPFDNPEPFSLVQILQGIPDYVSVCLDEERANATLNEVLDSMGEFLSRQEG